jgi:hypothetical protein
MPRRSLARDDRRHDRAGAFASDVAAVAVAQGLVDGAIPKRKRSTRS